MSYKKCVTPWINSWHTNTWVFEANCYTNDERERERVCVSDANQWRKEMIATNWISQTETVVFVHTLFFSVQGPELQSWKLAMVKKPANSYECSVETSLILVDTAIDCIFFPYPLFFTQGFQAYLNNRELSTGYFSQELYYFMLIFRRTSNL